MGEFEALCANDDGLATLRTSIREFLAADRAAYGWQPAVDCWLAAWDPEFSVRLAEAGFVAVEVHDAERRMGEISMLAVDEHVRSWPGGTGAYKLALNYAPTFRPQHQAAKLGYDQCLWLLGEKITEAGAMNFFVVVRRDDGGKRPLLPFNNIR